MNCTYEVKQLLDQLYLEPEALSGALQHLIDEYRFPNNKYIGPAKHFGKDDEPTCFPYTEPFINEAFAIESGVRTLDQQPGGLKNNRLYRVVSKDTQGATALMMTSAMLISRNERVVYFNYESPEDDF